MKIKTLKNRKHGNPKKDLHYETGAERWENYLSIQKHLSQEHL